MNTRGKVYPLNSQAGRINVVIFLLDGQRYALPIESIRQIIEMVTITPVPQVDHTIEGVINFHGAAVPVVNLGRHLGLTSKPPQLHTPIILATISERMVGLMVDDVLTVLTEPLDQVIHPKDILPEGLGEIPLLSGLIHSPAGMVMLLEPAQFFSSNHTSSLAEATAALEKEFETSPTVEAHQERKLSRKHRKKKSKPIPGEAPDVPTTSEENVIGTAMKL